MIPNACAAGLVADFRLEKFEGVPQLPWMFSENEGASPFEYAQGQKGRRKNTTRTEA